MRVPQVVIVGRPNVGKSSIFNWLAQKRLAIVDDTAGVTRDRMTFLLGHEDRFFEVVDTGGIGIHDVDDLTEEIEGQIAIALQSADVVLFVVDTQTGLLPLDQEVARRLRRINKPVLCVANKTDDRSWEVDAEQFRQLGSGSPLCVSTTAGRNREELLDAIVQRLPEDADSAAEGVDEPVMKLAIVGRRNVGKSTFVNTLAQAERMIVSEVPGTTRDSVDVRFEMDDKEFVAIDTPGLRRTRSVRSDIDFYGLHRAQRSIRRADVALLFLDAAEEISKVDKQLCQYIAGQFKPCIFVVNKWDLLYGKASTSEWADYLHETLPTMTYAPIAFITGQSGKNTKTLLNHAQMLFKQSRERVATGPLNSIIKRALQDHPPPLHPHRRPKILYATQIGIQPPTIVLICNQPAALSADYQRYLLGVLRDELRCGEVPIRLLLTRRKPITSEEHAGPDSRPN
jgi:GTP-binding protein